jgi:hypothetical protein
MSTGDMTFSGAAPSMHEQDMHTRKREAAVQSPTHSLVRPPSKRFEAAIILGIQPCCLEHGSVPADPIEVQWIMST